MVQLLQSPAVTRTPRSRKALVLCLAAIAVLTAMDLGTKQWALERLSQPSSRASDPVCEPNEYGRIETQRSQRHRWC